jgi:hypothetical protein
MSSPLKRLTRKVFEHHSNPWSAWTRLVSVPLVLVPFWTRSWKHASLVGAWLLLNPVVFSEPKDDSAWATRAMLGEEMWIAERPLDRAMAVNAAASAFGIGGVWASFKRKLLPTALCVGYEIALLLLYWQLMTEYYEEHRKDRELPCAFSSTTTRYAVVYGAGGAVGGAVARTFAREGAKVFLAGRTIAKLDALAEEITAAGKRGHGSGRCAGEAGRGCGQEGGEHRWQLQRYRDRPYSGNPAHGVVARGLQPPDHDLCEDAIPDYHRSCAAHGEK